jgi:hypothetical protein
MKSNNTASGLVTTVNVKIVSQWLHARDATTTMFIETKTT